MVVLRRLKNTWYLSGWTTAMYRSMDIAVRLKVDTANPEKTKNRDHQNRHRKNPEAP